MKKRER